MKKYMNFIAARAEPTGQFVHDIRRVDTKAGFFSACERYLERAPASVTVRPIPAIPPAQTPPPVPRT